MHHEQDIKKMGGLRRHIPAVFLSFLAATLALAGIFPLSGFFSKDEILWQTFVQGGHATWYYTLWVLGAAGAFATAFYMFRCVTLVFFGKERIGNEYEQDEADALEKKRHVDLHYQPFVPVQPPQITTLVVVALAVLSVIAGVLGIPHSLGKFVGLPNLMDTWLASVFPHAAAPVHEAGSLEYLLMALSVAIAVAGLTLATWLYISGLRYVRSFKRTFKWLYTLVLNKYYVDELYNVLFTRPLLVLNRIIQWCDTTIVDGLVNLTGTFGVVWSKASGWWDQVFVDGAVNAVAEATITAGRKLRMLQTGNIQHYFYLAVLGIVMALIWSFVI